MIQQKKQLLQGAGTVSRKNHLSFHNWSSDENNDAESGEGSSIQQDHKGAGRYNSVDDLMTELCQKAFNNRKTCRWSFSRTFRAHIQRLKLHAADKSSPSNEKQAAEIPPLLFMRLVSANLLNVLGVTTLSVQSFKN